MQKFRNHLTQLLVATDVAARGLDVDDLTHVINYGLPDDVENYTHLSGRTGRAGKKGTSISIIHTPGTVHCGPDQPCLPMFFIMKRRIGSEINQEHLLKDIIGIVIFPVPIVVAIVAEPFAKGVDICLACIGNYYCL